MKRLILLLMLVFFSGKVSDVASQARGATKDNQELRALHQADQSDRVGKVDWRQVSQRDQERRRRVYELLEANLVRTAKDHSHAAMIFQHGGDTVSSGMAVKLMRKAVALDPSIDKWLLAAAIDRDLLGRGQP